MKKILLILFAVITLSSCQDVFELPDDGRLSYELIFSDYGLTRNYLNTAYNYMPTLAMGYSDNGFLAAYSDEAHDAQDVLNGQASKYYEGMMSSSNNVIDGGIYSRMYEGIRTCNIFIDNIDHATNMRVESDRSKWKGEALTLRAFYYLTLIKRFGPMPIILHEVPEDFDYSNHTRPAFYENAKAIIADCDQALAEAEFPWRTPVEGQRGVVTKAVATAIKSQAILYAASPLWNDGNNYWQEAAAITKKCLDDLVKQGFELYNPASSGVKAYGNYQRFFILQPDIQGNPVDKETIYAHKGRIGEVWMQHGLPFMADVNKAGNCPSQELVDAYETIDGKPVLNLATPYSDNNHLVPDYNADNTMYDPANPYENRDPRLFSTIYCNGVFRNLEDDSEPVETFAGGNAEISQTLNKYTRTGYYLRKFVNYTSLRNTNNDGYWRYFRLAEMYLNYAEAEYYANGVTGNAVEATNTIRLRAGLPALPSGISSQEFELRLRNERRVELAFEEHRYFDVRRWKIMDKTDGIVTGMYITKTGNNDFKYDRILVSRRPVTDSKYLMWPIDVWEQNRYGKYGVAYQNPGW